MTSDVLAVGPRLAYAGVAIDGHKSQLAVGRGDDFMAGDAAFGDRGEHFAAGGIDDGEALVAFFGDQQAGLLGMGRCSAKKQCGNR